MSKRKKREKMKIEEKLWYMVRIGGEIQVGLDPSKLFACMNIK